MQPLNIDFFPHRFMPRRSKPNFRNKYVLVSMLLLALYLARVTGQVQATHLPCLISDGPMALAK